MLKTPGSAPIDHPNKVEELKEMAPKELCSTENSQLTVKMDTGSNPNHQTEGPEQVEVTDPVAAAKPVKTAEPVAVAEPVEAVEPVQASEPVPTTPETACTTEVSHVEEEKQEEYTPQSPPRSPGSPQVNGSIVNKLFSAFRPTTKENPQATPEYGLQL